MVKNKQTKNQRHVSIAKTADTFYNKKPTHPERRKTLTNYNQRPQRPVDKEFGFFLHIVRVNFHTVVSHRHIRRLPRSIPIDADDCDTDHGVTFTPHSGTRLPICHDGVLQRLAVQPIN